MSSEKRRRGQADKMRNVCVQRTWTIRQKGGNDAHRREAAEDCEMSVKDRLLECWEMAARGERVPSGPTPKFLTRVARAFSADAVMKGFIKEAAALEGEAHGQAHHQALPSALTTARLMDFAARAVRIGGGIKRHCRRTYGRRQGRNR
jgi:hypothetical protein